MRYEFTGLIFGGAYTWRGLFSEFYGMVFSQLTSTGQILFLVRCFWSVLNTEQADPGRNILLPWGDQEIFFVCSKCTHILSTLDFNSLWLLGSIKTNFFSESNAFQ